MDASLPVDLLHWALASLPLVLIGVLLVGLGWKAAESGPLGAFAAVAIAFLAFRSSLESMAVASGKGVWDAIFILYVIWPALILYLIADNAGAFDALRRGIRRFSENQLFLVLAFGWVFSSFLQGISGFGTPIAVVAPLLLAIGVKPLHAVAIPLIGHAWATMFGSVGVTWLATKQVIDMADPGATAWQTALLLCIPNLLAGLAIAWLFGRRAAVISALPFVLVISAIQGGGELLLALWNPVVSNFIAGSAALLALYPLSRWERYRQPAPGIEDRPGMEGDAREEGKERQQTRRERDAPEMGLGMALFPYAVLTVVAVAVLLPPGVEEALERFKIGLPFPQVATGYGVERQAKEPYSPISPLTHPGFFLLVASAVTWLVYRAKGYAGNPDTERQSFWRQLTDKAVPASIAIVSFLIMSQALDHSGQIRVLALGIAHAAPALVFASLSNFIGVLGAFITSSSTTSNMLFAPLQQTAAEAENLPEPAIIAAQSAGGATGNAVAPANVVLGASTAGLVGREGEVLRKTIPWVLATAVLTGLATVGLVTVMGGADDQKTGLQYCPDPAAFLASSCELRAYG